MVAYQGSRVPKANLYYDQAGAKKIAEQVVDLVRRKGVDFMELVSQLTDLPEQTRVPMLKRKGAPPFFQSALRLKEGQISDPVDSPFGYLIFHRVKLEKVTASHILLSFKGALRSTQNRSRGEALEMAKLLVAGLEAGKDFAALAKVHSNGPSASKGGLLGSFTRGQMVPEFDKAVFALKPSEVSGVVETPFGFHIIKRHE
ncbi:MAG: peptidylprolyl isomerase [SAR324 cluster bacterium]|nr:peptidylprolyl isomerase [SAR324 cluster bacterium]